MFDPKNHDVSDCPGECGIHAPSEVPANYADNARKIRNQKHLMDDLRVQSVARAARWHDGAEPWTSTDWANALGGECGEAQNIIKKIRCRDTGINQDDKAGSRDDLLVLLGHELADVIIYADLLAHNFGMPALERSYSFKSHLDVVAGWHLADYGVFLGSWCSDAQFFTVIGRTNWPSILRVVAATYALAEFVGIDLDAAIVAKFNIVSDRYDFPEKLAL